MRLTLPGATSSYMFLLHVCNFLLYFSPPILADVSLSVRQPALDFARLPIMV